MVGAHQMKEKCGNGKDDSSGANYLLSVKSRDMLTLAITARAIEERRKPMASKIWRNWVIFPNSSSANDTAVTA